MLPHRGGTEEGRARLAGRLVNSTGMVERLRFYGPSYTPGAPTSLDARRFRRSLPLGPPGGQATALVASCGACCVWSRGSVVARFGWFGSLGEEVVFRCFLVFQEFSGLPLVLLVLVVAQVGALVEWRYISSFLVWSLRRLLQPGPFPEVVLVLVVLPSSRLELFTFGSFRTCVPSFSSLGAVVWSGAACL